MRVALTQIELAMVAVLRILPRGNAAQIPAFSMLETIQKVTFIAALFQSESTPSVDAPAGARCETMCIKIVCTVVFSSNQPTSV